MEGVDELQLERQRALLLDSGRSPYESDSESDSDTDIPDAPLRPEPRKNKSGSAELEVDTEAPPKIRKKKVDHRGPVVESSDEDSTEEGEPVDETPG